MKKVLFTLLIAFITLNVDAQAPESFKYQSVVRNVSGNVITNQNVNFQISILQASSTGISVYMEQHNVTTNNFGLANLNIGTGTVVSGDFTAIDWGVDTYFVKIELDVSGGTNFQLMGTSQLLSVPYALHSKTAESISGTLNETDPVFGASIANGITASDTANWNNHTLDTDTQIDSLGIANLGFISGPHTINTQLDSIGISSFGYVAGAHTIDTDTQIDSTGIANYGFITNFNEIDGDSTNELQTLSISNDTIFLSNGGFVKLPNQTGSNGGFQKFSVSGSFTVPNGVSSLKVEVWGAGGGGSRWDGSTGGAGGGGGGYGKILLNVIAGQTYAITVGTGGIGANSNSMSGGNGGDSNFGSLVIASGGSGGDPNANGGGAGGTCSSEIAETGNRGGNAPNATPGLGGRAGGFANTFGAGGQGANSWIGISTAQDGQNGLVIIYW